MLRLTVVAEHQVPPGVCESSRLEAQQRGEVLQGVQVVLGAHAEHVQMVSKVRAHHHLQKQREGD